VSFPAAVLALAMQNAFVQVGPSISYSDADIRRIYDEYGDCVVRRFSKQASSAVLENVDDETLMKRRRVLIDSDCLKPAGRGMRSAMLLQADRLRYSVADALVRRELAGLPPPIPNSLPKLQHWDPGEEPTNVLPSGKHLRKSDYEEALQKYREKSAFSAFSEFGECVVRSDPGAAKALLATRPETKQEDIAFGGVRPALAGCLSQGQTFAFTKLSLRGTIAVNYYRLAKASGTAPQTSSDVTSR
jgi:hypothetical protein